MEKPTLEVTSVQVGSLAANCYLIADRRLGEAVIVDPGDEAERVASEIEKRHLVPQSIVLTHGHVDHAGAAADLSRRWKIPVLVHDGERDLLGALGVQAQLFGLPVPDVPDKVESLRDADAIEVGAGRLEVRHTPGHSPGGITLLDQEGHRAWVGDLVFRGSVGRTDLPGGSTETLLRSIQSVILALPDDWVLYPGHGPPTTVGEERRTNPFLV